jgi:hypothetical protein
MFLLRALLVWLVIIVTETVNGILRGILLVPIVGDLPARQIGVLIGSLLIFAVTLLSIRWIAARKTLQLLSVGLLWVVLTVLFEIWLGRLVLCLPWDRITEDYDITRGGFLGFGLLFMAVSQNSKPHYTQTLRLATYALFQKNKSKLIHAMMGPKDQSK